MLDCSKTGAEGSPCQIAAVMSVLYSQSANIDFNIH